MRLFIVDCHVKVSSDMWNLGFKELMHISMNPILLFFLFSSHIASSCNITSV